MGWKWRLFRTIERDVARSVEDPEPWRRGPRGAWIVEDAAKRGAMYGVFAGLASALVANWLLPAPRPVQDELLGHDLHSTMDRVVRAGVFMVVGSLLFGAIGYAVGEAVGQRRRREVDRNRE